MLTPTTTRCPRPTVRPVLLPYRLGAAGVHTLVAADCALLVDLPFVGERDDVLDALPCLNLLPRIGQC